MILKKKEIKVILEVEESNTRPIQICGKFLTSVLSSYFIHETTNDSYIPMSDSVLFIQVVDTSKLNEEKTSKIEQWKNIEKSINDSSLVGIGKVKRYELYFGKVDDFKETIETKLISCISEFLTSSQPVLKLDVEKIIKEIDDLQDVYLRCKSIFPALSPSLIGQTAFPTAPIYKWQGYNVSINTCEKITPEFIERYAEIGNWINENSIIRLFGILHYYGQVGNKTKILPELPGREDVRYCCWIRNVITKTNLNYEPSDDSRSNELISELVSYYKLKSDDYKEGEIPTPVDKVILAMFEGCRKYLRAKYNSTEQADGANQSTANADPGG